MRAFAIVLYTFGVRSSWLLVWGASMLAGVYACSESDEARAPDAGAGDAASLLDATSSLDGTAPDAHSDTAADAASACDDAGTAISKQLSCTGLYTNTAAKQLVAGVQLYKPAREFWSDGAEKSRYVYLPSNSQIDTKDWGSWKFPVGTKFWKEFRLAGKRIETRLYAKTTASAWERTSYRWNQAETEALRNDLGEKNVAQTTYEIPEGLACDQCHGAPNDHVLGFDAVALGMPGATGYELTKLIQDQRLTDVPAKLPLVLPSDGSGKSDDALLYIHVNCGPCHNRDALANAFQSGLFMRLDAKQLLDKPVAKTVDPYVSVLNTPTTTDPYKNTAFVRLVPGDPARSAVCDAPSSRGQKNSMPPIISHTVDTNGVALLKAWVAAMPAQ